MSVLNGDILLHHGNILNALNNWKASEKQIKLALSAYQRTFKADDTQGAQKIASASNSLGNVYRMLDQYNDAVEQHQAAYSLFSEIQDKYGMANTSLSLEMLIECLASIMMQWSSIKLHTGLFSEIQNKLGIANASNAWRCLSNAWPV